MKANEAPEKIYVHRTVHLGLLAASEMNITGNDIEYTRTDAFIEKTCSWIENNFNMPNDFKEYFKKAMKI